MWPGWKAELIFAVMEKTMRVPPIIGRNPEK
jgi:hypothetical protein